VPVEGLSCGLWPADDDLQPVQSLELEGSLGPDIRGAGCPGRAAERPQHRLDRRPGASLGPRRKRGAKAQAIGRSRGGPTTKIHALTDENGRIAAFSLTPGNVADISAAPALLAALPPPCRLIADKGYDANSLREALAAERTEAVIPSTRSRKRPIPHDVHAYRERNRIERAFCSLKDWRRVATRYDRLARNFAAGVAIAAIIIWWT
jgi:transposase